MAAVIQVFLDRHDTDSNITSCARRARFRCSDFVRHAPVRRVTPFLFRLGSISFVALAEPTRITIPGYYHLIILICNLRSPPAIHFVRRTRRAHSDYYSGLLLVDCSDPFCMSYLSRQSGVAVASVIILQSLSSVVSDLPAHLFNHSACMPI